MPQIHAQMQATALEMVRAMETVTGQTA